MSFQLSTFIGSVQFLSGLYMFASSTLKSERRIIGAACATSFIKTETLSAS